jgi:transposase-like protein
MLTSLLTSFYSYDYIRIYILDNGNPGEEYSGHRELAMAKAAVQNPAFTDDEKARETFEAVRWPNGPVCPHCGNVDQDKIAKAQGKAVRPGLYYCAACNDQFTVTVGTVMESSKISISKWLFAMHLMGSSKKGISAHQLHRLLGITYKSAWFLAHRIREAMTDTSGTAMGGEGGQIQADETYYGNTSKRSKSYRKGLKRKAAVVALVDPANGQARAFHMELGVGAHVVRDILVTNASRKSTLVSDESKLYTRVGAEFAAHETVLHAGREYVNKGGFTTNNVENFFGTFKRGMRGTYHFCGEQHLQRYLNEFSFRYSNRSGLGVEDGERVARMLKGIEGKRLTYRPTH